MDPAICLALFKGNLCQLDVDRLKGLMKLAPGEEGFAKKESYVHKLWDVKVHSSKSSTGQVRIFWPPDTPTAQAIPGMRGGKAKGYSSGKGKDKDFPNSKKKNAEKAEGSWSGGGPKWNYNYCYQCKVSDTFVDGACVVCADQDNMEQDKEQEDGVQEQQTDMQQDKVEAEPQSDAPTAKYNMSHLEDKLAKAEDLLASLHFCQQDDPVLVGIQAEVQAIKQTIAEAQAELKQTPVEDADADLKAQRESYKESIKKAKKMQPPEGQEFVPLVAVLEERLAKLQPKPKEKSIPNQLKLANAALKKKQEDRENICSAKTNFQTQVEELQQKNAKLDRKVATVDDELVELSQQAAVLLEKNTALLLPNSQPNQPEVQADGLSEEEAMKIIKLWPKQFMEKLHQAQVAEQQAPTVAQAPAASLPGEGGAASHRGAGASPPTRQRQKPKEIPIVTTEQKAATVRDATGAAREEQLRVARLNAERADDLNDLSDGEESQATKMRVDEESAAAQDWKGA